MLAWIIYNRDSARYNRQYIKFYMEEGAKLGITVKLILTEELEFGVKNDQWYLTYQKNDENKPDFAICRVIYPLLSRQLEYMGIRVFNSSAVSEICNDKARTYQYLAKTGIRMVDTSFYRNNSVKDILAKVENPTVMKAVEGHGGSQVFLLEPTMEAEKHPSELRSDRDEKEQSQDHNMVITGLGSSDVVVQPLIGSRHQDLRVYVIGKEIIAGVIRTAKQGFKSNFSLGGEVKLYRLTEEEINIVNKIIEQFDFDFVGIDFILGDEGELIFNEIEDVVGSRMLYQCANINVVEKYLNHILEQLK